MNHVQIFLWWWWADINGTLGSVGLEAQGFGTNLTLITMVDSLRLRWPICRPYYTSPFCLTSSYVLVTWWSMCVEHFYWSQVTPHSSAFSVLRKVFDAVFLHKASWLWFGCHSFVRVRSMSVAPSCLPPPTRVLLNESCGSLVVARSRASSSTLYWPAYNSLRLISACLVSQLLDWALSGPVSGRTKSLFTFWFHPRWMLYPLVSTHGLFWIILRLSHGAKWIITV